MTTAQHAKMARYITHFSNHGAMATISSREPTTRYDSDNGDGDDDDDHDVNDYDDND